MTFKQAFLPHLVGGQVADVVAAGVFAESYFLKTYEYII
jgi:hypothetical protein